MSSTMTYVQGYLIQEKRLCSLSQKPGRSNQICTWSVNYPSIVGTKVKNSAYLMLLMLGDLDWELNQYTYVTGLTWTHEKHLAVPFQP